MAILEFPCVIKQTLVLAVCCFIQVFQLVLSTCPSPPKPYGTSYNGTTNKEYGEGTVLAYRCMIGYSRIDTSDNVRKCLRDGTWSSRDQVCILNFFNVFLSLMAAVGVVIIFIFLVCCRIYIQGQKELEVKHKRSINKRNDDVPPGILRNGGKPIAENPYDLEMTRLDRRLDHTLDEDDSSEGTLNKVLCINDDPDDHEKHGYEISASLFDNDEYLKPNQKVQEQEELTGYLKPRNYELNGTNTLPNGSRHHGRSKGHDRSKDRDRSTDNKRSKGRKAKRVNKRYTPQELDGYLKPGPEVDMVNASPLYYTPSFAKQGTGWIHDDTSFDSLEIDIDDVELKEKDTKI